MHLGCWEKALHIFCNLQSRYPEFEHAHINAVDTLFLSEHTAECKKMCKKILKETQIEKVRIHAERILESLKVPSLKSGPTVFDRLSQVPHPWFSCTHCGAVFPIDTNTNSICGDCGAIVCKEESACRYCTNNGRVPIELIDVLTVCCPICRKGTIVAADNAEL